jgi:hypothetical protein
MRTGLGEVVSYEGALGGRPTALVQDLPVVPTGGGEFAPTLLLAVPMFWYALGEQAKCLHPTSLYRLPADNVTGRRKKPSRLSCNATHSRNRGQCGPQARFWEAQRYPASVWMIGSVSAGATLTVAYIAFLCWFV